jgi:hypothetical protein
MTRGVEIVPFSSSSPWRSARPRPRLRNGRFWDDAIVRPAGAGDGRCAGCSSAARTPTQFIELLPTDGLPDPSPGSGSVGANLFGFHFDVWLSTAHGSGSSSFLDDG